jgi:hypothetical protein
MGSFEWLELETLSREIADLEDRLGDAKSTKNHGLMRLLEKNLGDAKHRRERVLDAISRHMASSAAAPSGKKAAAAPDSQPTKGAAEVPATPDVVEETQAAVEPEPEVAVTDAASSAPVPFAEPIEGATTVWDQLTPDHIEQAKRELDRRRAETVARHAAELKALEADQDEIGALDRAIAAFTHKFSQRPEAAAEVVQLNQERGTRAHGHG